MANGRFENYYWEIFAFLIEHSDIVQYPSPDFSISEAFEANYWGVIQARIPFRDNSILRIVVGLSESTTRVVIENRYAYIYYAADGKRIFQYDNRDHHPEISTYPHHKHKGPRPTTGSDLAWSSDLNPVNFKTVVTHIYKRFFSS